MQIRHWLHMSPASLWRISFCAALICAWTSPARSQGLIPADGVTEEVAAHLAQAGTQQVNELSNRRRLTSFFTNEQSPFYGVQINFVNVRRGNLTFLNRDLVRLDRMPLVFGRVYDSQLRGPSDFGPGWKLTVAEAIRRDGDQLSYRDASGSVYELTVQGDSVLSPYPHLTGILEGRLGDSTLDLRVGDLTKQFRLLGDTYFLVAVRDSSGQSLHFQYQGRSIVKIESTSGRYIEIERDPQGRIRLARDDAGRTVSYDYDDSGNLSRFQDVGGGIWLLAYDQSDRLIKVIDPRGNPAVTANHNDAGRAAHVSILFDSMSFAYDRLSTRVDSALGTSATFWHDDSGLTRAAQDFEGGYTEIEFNDSLQATALSFNGGSVALLAYDATGQVTGLRSRLRGAEDEFAFAYDGAGRLSQVVKNDETVASYAYGPNGLVLIANDRHGNRQYRYTDDGRLTGIRVDERTLNLRTSERGMLLGFSDDQNTVRIEYDDRDQVRTLMYRTEVEDIREVVTQFEYSQGGLRNGGAYRIENDDRGTISYVYDPTGNLTDIGLRDSSGNEASQRYELGSNNELVEISSPSAPSVQYEYNGAGRPVRSLIDGYETEWGYDNLGRLSSMSVNGTQYLGSAYGPMDLDAATEADGHTPLTTIAVPVASSIFGSLESVAYTRVRGATHGPIRFNATMGRFTLAESVAPSPDSVLLASLNRRSIPVQPVREGSPAVNPLPLGFDKPSNGLFLPAEYSSLNCYGCTFYGAGAIMWLEINGTSSGTAQGTVGVPNDITSVGTNTYCYWAMCLPGFGCMPWNQPTRVSFDYSFGDGTSTEVYDDPRVQKTYPTAGTRTVTGVATCWGCDFYNPVPLGVMAQASRQLDIEACVDTGYTVPPGPSLPPFSRPQLIDNGNVIGLTTVNYDDSSLVCAETCIDGETLYRLEGDIVMTPFLIEIASHLPDVGMCSGTAREQQFVSETEIHETIHANAYKGVVDQHRQALGAEYTSASTCNSALNNLKSQLLTDMIDAQAAQLAHSDLEFEGRPKHGQYCPVSGGNTTEYFCGDTGKPPCPGGNVW